MESAPFHADPAPPSRPAARAARVHSFTRHLVVFALAITLPVLVFVGLVLGLEAASERERVSQAGMETARGIADLIEKDLEALTASLQTVAVSPRLAEGDLAGFHRVASEAARIHRLPIFLMDASGGQVLNTLNPYGTDLPPADVDVSQVFASKRPHLYDLFHASGAQAPIAALFVPVLRPGGQEVAYALGFGLRTERLRDLLWRSELPEGSVAALVDRSGLIVARTRDHDRWVGQEATPLKGRLGDRALGQLALTNLDGNPMLASFTRLEPGGWTVVNGVPTELVGAPVRDLLVQLAVVGALLAMVSAGLGVVFGRRIATALSRLQASAGDLGRGAVVPALETPVAEINEVGRTLSDASRNLRAMSDAQEALLFEVNHRVKNSLTAVVSLLTLQGRQTSDPETRRGLDEAKLRVQAIASIHQRLYESGHHDRVDLCTFFADTFHETVKALDGEGRVSLDYSCDDDIVLGVSQATPLALVVTEFITNSLKHAHPGQGGGRLTLSIKRDDAKLITVSVEDDGRGVPPDFDPERPGGMGMRIVTALARQLRGRLDIGAGLSGARFAISFLAE